MKINIVILNNKYNTQYNNSITNVYDLMIENNGCALR